MLSDPIADMLARMKNVALVKKRLVDIPLSKFKVKIIETLKKEGYIEDFKEEGRNIRVYLKYEDGKPVVSNLKRVSKPGRRVYLKKGKLPKVLGGWGIAIVSTPKGVMTAKEAKSKNLGGEILCKVW